MIIGHTFKSIHFLPLKIAATNFTLALASYALNVNAALPIYQVAYISMFTLRLYTKRTLRVTSSRFYNH